MKPCKKCSGTGVWVPDGDPDYDDAPKVSRACLWCDGTGEVPTLEEEKADWELERRQKLFKGRGKGEAETGTKPTAAALAGPEEWARMVQGWWERERAARIRAGACKVCGERGCPRVGGRERECVA